MDDNLFVNVKTCTSKEFGINYLVPRNGPIKIHGDKLQYLIQ